MPPRTPLPPAAPAWRCPQCTTHRRFTTTRPVYELGPEHPRYIAIPEPPQQTIPDRNFIKGRLPVPRDVFAGSNGKDKASHEWLDSHTRRPKHAVEREAGSREEWKGKMSEMRRRNLREGLASLRVRKTNVENRLTSRAQQKQTEREELVNRPEREEDRLTAPSHGLDLDAIFSRTSSPADNAARLNTKQANLATHSQAKATARLTALHTLYLNARTFIITPSALDKAVDEAFGSAERPVTFGDEQSTLYGGGVNSASVWAYGRPERVQDMLARANSLGGKKAMDGVGGFSAVNRERVGRIGEVLTGGKMDEAGR